MNILEIKKVRYVLTFLRGRLLFMYLKDELITVGWYNITKRDSKTMKHLCA